MNDDSIIAVFSDIYTTWSYFFITQSILLILIQFCKSVNLIYLLLSLYSLVLSLMSLYEIYHGFILLVVLSLHSLVYIICNLHRIIDYLSGQYSTLEELLR